MMPQGMPPVIHQPPYGYSGMPMPPMGMMMNRPPPVYNQMPPKPISNSPITKVFVGNISERAPDSMIRQMLQRCGNVLNWKRVEGTNGKLQAFGFCEFVEPQYTLRCIRLLNGYEIAEKKLLVKVDQKTRELLGEYIKKNRPDKTTKNAKKAAALRNIRGSLIRPPEDGEVDDEDDPKNINLEAVDEDTLKEDRVTIGALELILKQYAKDLDPPEETPEAEKVPTVAPPPVDTTSTETSAPGGVYMKPHLRLEEIKLDDDKKEFMTSEISKFRETHKDEEVKIKQEERDRLNRVQEKDRIERDKLKNSERENSQKRGSRDREDRRENRSSQYNRHRSPRSGERDIKESRINSSSRRYERSRTRSPIDRGTRRDRRSPEVTERPYRDRGDAASRSPDRRYRKSDSVNKENTQTPEELEEERERKKLERRLREKEMAYRARLKLWEEREEKKRRHYLTDKKNEMQKRKISLKEAKKLRQFMEDYDDEKDDSTYFKGSSLEKKLKFREKEIESDNRDRQREKEEIEELKKRLSEKGFSDVDHEAKRIQDDENLRMKIKFDKLEQSSSSSDEDSDQNIVDELPVSEEVNAKTNNHQPEPMHVENKNDDSNQLTKEFENDVTSHSQSEAMSFEETDITVKNEIVIKDSNTVDGFSEDSNSSFNQTSETKSTKLDEYVTPSSNSPTFIGFSTEINHSTTKHVTIKSMSIKKSIQPINQAFADEDDESNGPPKRAKLISSDSTPSGMNSDDKRKAVKKLVESIPTDRDELFAYKIDWEQLDENLMEKRIKPWINKKIIEYIGEEEATLHDFICSKIQQRTEPGKLLEEIKVILDDEAELFVKKMWRLIVYETESKRNGLSR